MSKAPYRFFYKVLFQFIMDLGYLTGGKPVRELEFSEFYFEVEDFVVFYGEVYLFIYGIAGEDGGHGIVSIGRVFYAETSGFGAVSYYCRVNTVGEGCFYSF